MKGLNLYLTWAALERGLERESALKLYYLAVMCSGD